MKNINRIYWQEDAIGLLTNHIDAQLHSHWMLQLFLCVDDYLNIKVANQDIKCKCIVVDKNISHEFHTNQRVYFSALIDPTSTFAKQLSTLMNDQGFVICDYNGVDELQSHLLKLIQASSVENYASFKSCLLNYLNLNQQPQLYDERIISLLKYINSCDCDTHEIALFAKKVSLSSSRLSHLFKTEVGVPLKSYLILHQIKKAFILLSKGSNITEACLMAGFDTPSHFAGTVKRMMGMNTTLSLKDSEFLQVSKY